jgi:uncharacterized membrane protein YkgB
MTTTSNDDWPISEELQKENRRGLFCTLLALAVGILSFLVMIHVIPVAWPSKTVGIVTVLSVDVFIVVVSFMGIRWSRRPPLYQPSHFSVGVFCLVLVLPVFESLFR